jgi:hypothetical protein
MAIKLGLPKGPQWFDLGFGVRVHCRPLTTAIYQCAEASARRQVAKLFDAKGEVEDHGGVIDGLPNLTTEDGRAGYGNFLFAQALAREAITEWEGIEENDGTLAKPTPEKIDEVMTWHALAETFVHKYTAAFRARIVEKKTSTGSAPGSSKADGDIATIA